MVDKTKPFSSYMPHGHKEEPKLDYIPRGRYAAGIEEIFKFPRNRWNSLKPERKAKLCEETKMKLHAEHAQKICQQGNLVS